VVAVLTRATQELARTVDAKNAEIAELKKRLAEQDARLTRIETLLDAPKTVGAK